MMNCLRGRLSYSRDYFYSCNLQGQELKTCGHLLAGYFSQSNQIKIPPYSHFHDTVHVVDGYKTMNGKL